MIHNKDKIEIVQYFIDTGKNNTPYLKSMSKVRMITESNGFKYTLIDERPDYVKGLNISITRESVLVRIHELSTNPRTFWLDSDCEISDSIFGFRYNIGKPYIYKGESCGACAMYANDCCNVFKKIDYDASESCICKQYLNKLGNSFYFIPMRFIANRKYVGLNIKR